MSIAVIIPALNEAECIADLVDGVKAQPVDEVIVVDNGSDDDTAVVAQKAGARVVLQPSRGYGYACAAGVAAASNADALVFLDGDGSFLPEEMPALLAPLCEGHADLVLGSRALGGILPDAMPPHQLYGNWLASRLIRALYGVRVTDIGPYRAIKAEVLRALCLHEMTFGWPTEMIVKAARQRARIVEVPVSYRPRLAGRSKVSGTLRGTILASYHILGATLRHAR